MGVRPAGVLVYKEGVAMMKINRVERLFVQNLVLAKFFTCVNSVKYAYLLDFIVCDEINE